MNSPGPGSCDCKAISKKLRKRFSPSPVLSVLATLVVCLGFPALFLSTVPKSLYQLAENRIDPYVYAAYIHDYTRTLERFGNTYYSGRIAYILPERAFVTWLGVEAGYYVFRFLALAAAIFSVYAIARRYYGLATAVVVSAWVCFTPWLPRSLLWTHYDGVAVVYLLIAAALLLAPSTWRLSAHGAAGAVFALAVNCNQLLFAMGAAFLPGWLVMNRHYGATWIARAVLCLLGGFVLSYALLIFVLSFESPGNGLEATRSAISTAVSLLTGGSNKWSLPLGELLAHPFERSTIVLLIPAILLVVGICSADKRSLAFQVADDQTRFELASLLFLALTAVLALLLHFVFTHHWLAHYYYNVYFFPASVLVLICLGGKIELRDRSTLTYGICVGLIALWLGLPSFLLTIVDAGPWIAVIIILIAAVGSFALVSMTQRRNWPAGFVGVVLMISLLPIFASDYRMIGTAEDRQREWDVYRGSIFLQRFIDQHVPTSRSIGFWYSNLDLLMYSIQSMFLWQYTRVAPAEDGHPGMPLLDEKTRTAMIKKNFLALLGASQVQVDNAVEVINKTGLPFRLVVRTSFSGRTWGFHAALLKGFPPQLGAPLFEVPLSRLFPDHGSQVTQLSNGIRLITGPQRYGYDLHGPLRVESDPSGGKVVIRAVLEVEKGVVGIAVEDANDTSKLFETSLKQTGEMETVDIEIPDLASAGRFIVRNYRNTPSTVILRTIQVFRAD